MELSNMWRRQQSPQTSMDTPRVATDPETVRVIASASLWKYAGRDVERAAPLGAHRCESPFSDPQTVSLAQFSFWALLIENLVREVSLSLHFPFHAYLMMRHRPRTSHVLRCTVLPVPEQGTEHSSLSLEIA